MRSLSFVTQPVLGRVLHFGWVLVCTQRELSDCVSEPPNPPFATVQPWEKKHKIHPKTSQSYVHSDARMMRLYKCCASSASRNKISTRNCTSVRSNEKVRIMHMLQSNITGKRRDPAANAQQTFQSTRTLCYQRSVNARMPTNKIYKKHQLALHYPGLNSTRSII
jgi:hypothetical protein